MESIEALLLNAYKLIDICDFLKNKGVKRKDIASRINMSASSFSSLMKTVMPRIIRITKDDENWAASIDDCFSLVNNLSQNKILANLENYIKILENYDDVPVKRIKTEIDFFDKLRNQSLDTAEFINSNFGGLYDCYYLSSDQYRVKKEPFLINMPDEDKSSLEILKGNNKSHIRYKGTGFGYNFHTLTFFLCEDDHYSREYLCCHLNIPSIKKMSFLRGIFSTITFAHQPIARKIVLVKVENSIDMDKFNSIESEYIDGSENCEYPEIIEYLTDRNSKIECIQVYKPSFSTKDLIKEIEIHNDL